MMYALSCCVHGPGYKTPEDAINGPREVILYVICVQPYPHETQKSDYLATIDVDPESPTYCKVLHRLFMPHAGDELHQMGWNACSSCFDNPKRKRSHLVLPGLYSDRVHIVDVATDCRAPCMSRVIEPEEINKLNVGGLHTVHCLSSGEVMISCMGDAEGNAMGTFLLVDSEDFSLKDLWHKGQPAKLNYDFWYQPRHNVMISTEASAPNVFRPGFNIQDIHDGKYGNCLHVWDWKERKLIQEINLGSEGILPLKIRFLHDPDATVGFVGCAFSGNVFKIYQLEDKTWNAKKVIDIPTKRVQNWLLEDMTALISTIIISLDDKYLYLSNWSHGDIRQYDITDTDHPVLVGQIFLAGSILSDGAVKVAHDEEMTSQPEPQYIKNKRIQGAPQMLQLSLDGKRLYVTNSLLSVWDRQFYPEMTKKGSMLMLIDVDDKNGGLTLNKDFLVDFGAEPDGPALAHDILYPGGDCASEIWI